jgi:hypothetical protein
MKMMQPKVNDKRGVQRINKKYSNHLVFSYNKLSPKTLKCPSILASKQIGHTNAKVGI